MRYAVGLALAALLAMTMAGCGGKDVSIQTSNAAPIKTKSTIADQVYLALKPSINEPVYPMHGAKESDMAKYLAKRALDVTESRPEWNAKQPDTTSLKKDSASHPGNVEQYLRYEFKDGSALNLVAVPVGYEKTTANGLQLDRVEIERP